jgi:serine phosphatase RsbU (regulator of sigma subunit)
MLVGSSADCAMGTSSSPTRPASAGIALQHPQGVLVVWIELAEKRPFTDEDQTTLTVLAGRLGQGLQRVQLLDQQRETALALQHAILGPNLLPAGFAARYEPANRPMQVGGDWYDVVDLDDGRIGLIVGDCVGHGLAAATVMGQLRSACRALLLENPSPREALAALDRFAARLTGAECTSAFCAVLSPETGELTYSSAGHPPPILVYADGSHRGVANRPLTPRSSARCASPGHLAAVYRRPGGTPPRAARSRHRPRCRRPREGK